MADGVTCKLCGAQPGSKAWPSYRNRWTLRETAFGEIDLDVGVFCSPEHVVLYLNANTSAGERAG